MNEWFGVTADDNDIVTHLNLRYNQLAGTIPAALGDLTNLEALRLHENELLTGKIPSWGSLINLKDLSLDSNMLTGEIPSDLGNLTNLTSLFLRENNLNGEIPSELGALTNLRRLYLNENDLAGEIPTELGSLTQLQELHLNNNMLTGIVPEAFADLADLQELHIANNPDLICIPQGITTGSITFDVHGLPICSDRAHLEYFYNATNGDGWTAKGDSDDNPQGPNTGWLSDAPIGEWFGVTVRDGRVVRLNLRNNNLTGKIPTTWHISTGWPH